MIAIGCWSAWTLYTALYICAIDYAVRDLMVRAAHSKQGGENE